MLWLRRLVWLLVMSPVALVTVLSGTFMFLVLLILWTWDWVTEGKVETEGVVDFCWGSTLRLAKGWPR